MIYEYECYQIFLRDCLADRVINNPTYSLRAFARDLDMAPSMLSQTIAGKRNLSQSSAFKITEKLGMRDKEKKFFLLLLEYKTSRNLEHKYLVLDRLTQLKPKKYKQMNLSIDNFRVISQWYHYPILELTEIQGFTFNSKNIAKCLGITKIEAEAALLRLKRMDLLEIDTNGVARQKQTNLIVDSSVADSGLQQYHKVLLEKSISSLQTQSPKEKIIGSEVFALDPSDFTELKELVDDFLNKISSKARSGKRKKNIYTAIINIFNLTSNE